MLIHIRQFDVKRYSIHVSNKKSLQSRSEGVSGFTHFNLRHYQRVSSFPLPPLPDDPLSEELKLYSQPVHDSQRGTEK